MLDNDTKTLLIDIVGELQFNTMRRAEKDKLAERVKRHISLDESAEEAKSYLVNK